MKNSKRTQEIIRHYFADIVYGATDGIVTTFSIVSGVEGAKLAPIVAVILGIVNLLADGVSMGAASFLSFRSGALAKDLTVDFKEPFKHAITTFFSFVIFGGIPLISFLIPGFDQHRFVISCVLTGIALFIVGRLRSIVAKESTIRGAAEMLLIGGSASIIAYWIGSVLAEHIR